MLHPDTNSFAYKSRAGLRRARLVFWIFKHKNISDFLQFLLKIALKLRLPIDFILKKTAYGHFVAGETIKKSEPVIQSLGKYGVDSILDYSVEGGKDEAGFRHAVEETKRTIENAVKNKFIPFAVFKPSALTYEWVLKQKKTDELKVQTDFFESRMFELFDYAAANSVPLLVDAEDVDFQDIIDHIVEKGMQKYNQSSAIVFQTLQMYRVDRLEYLQGLFKQASEYGYIPGIKLVRGAYMEKERERAKAAGKPSPIYPDKDSTDKAYNKALEICMQHYPGLVVFNGTHNWESSEYLTRLMKEKGLDNNDKNTYFAQLYGMSDELSFSLARESYNVAKYLPYGPVKQVMPYLMRRAEENSSVSEQAEKEYRLVVNEIKRRKHKKVW